MNPDGYLQLTGGSTESPIDPAPGDPRRRAGEMKMSLPTITHDIMGSDNEYQ